LRPTQPICPGAIQDAQDAIMDQIEDTFQTASQSERESLTNAMNSLRELRRLVQTSESEIEVNVKNFSDA
jgi:Spy/CpxP family protein refolding chaperone